MYEAIKSIPEGKADFAASCLRLQVSALENALGRIENSFSFDSSYMETSLRRIEKRYLQIKKDFIEKLKGGFRDEKNFGYGYGNIVNLV